MGTCCWKPTLPLVIPKSTQPKEPYCLDKSETWMLYQPGNEETQTCGGVSSALLHTKCCNTWTWITVPSHLRVNPQQPKTESTHNLTTTQTKNMQNTTLTSTHHLYWQPLRFQHHSLNPTTCQLNQREIPNIAELCSTTTSHPQPQPVIFNHNYWDPPTS